MPTFVRTLLTLCAPAWLVACSTPGHVGPETPGTPPPRAGGPFPRLASYRIENHLDPAAADVVAKTDLAIIDAEVGALDPAVLQRLRARRPDLDLLAYLTSEEIWHAPDVAEMPLAAARLQRIPPAFWLLEPGSRLLEPVDATSTTLRVADPGAFSIRRPASQFYPEDEPTYLLVGNEHMKLTGIRGDTLIVERGYRSAPRPHGDGSTIAAHVVFFSGTWMLNVAASAPSDPGGRTWRDMLSDEAAGLVRSGPWNGIFLDVCFSDVSFLNGGLLDVDRDGVADDPQLASRQWSRGMGQLVESLRGALGPHAPIIANPGAQDCPHPQLDGVLLEGWPVGLPTGFQTFEAGLERYLRWTKRDGRPLSVANGFSPKIGFGVIRPGDDEVARTDYASMRFGLGVALLGDGYYAFDNGVFGHYVSWWYDEYDGGGRGRGWLGYALGSYEGLPGGALGRAFERGYVVVNPKDVPVVTRVPPSLRRLRGTQDPAHNDGSLVTGPLEVAAKDGFLLVRD